ncbi:MAG: hypothetical protein D5R99_05660 [Methanocalculus sp. MSAO_Arc1]|uniref:DUF7123 family protein n=1 Tax=Methanocalculus TaxID=71151 RepID=UPI000FF4367D|nr:MULTISPECIES: hypothetical protein [unclassified Methanocalculus]MCP1661812.1 putative AlkP superfamily pyrophosphatase or phosphodiesterase [Methanocalculus sp. AMF5]RQD80204.1 MAG: hypothetical protein D5R99_05660 [Methanocalculus sp. MSAO_Arc1]
MTVPDSIRNKYNETQDRILKYLRGGIQKGRHFFKSKYIARDLGLSSKEVGTNLAILSEICDDLEIKRWSYSNSTTWMVTSRAI